MASRGASRNTAPKSGMVSIAPMIGSKNQRISVERNQKQADIPFQDRSVR